MSIEAKLYKITIDKPEPPFYYVGWTAQVGKGDSYLHSSLNKQLKEDIESTNIELSSEIIDEINLVHKNNPNPAP